MSRAPSAGATVAKKSWISIQPGRTRRNVLCVEKVSLRGPVTPVIGPKVLTNSAKNPPFPNIKCTACGQTPEEIEEEEKHHERFKKEKERVIRRRREKPTTSVENASHLD
jgi:hypothetical protein